MTEYFFNLKKLGKTCTKCINRSLMKERVIK